MKSKKQAIQDTAIILFNEKGYEQVSLRDIAKEADTTIGNLTYHFPHKEDLLLNIQKNFHSTFNEFFDSNLRETELLERIIDSFIMAEKNENESPFYYKNIYDLTKDSAAASIENIKFQKKLYDYYIKSFTFLKEDKIIQESIDEIAIASLVYTIITILSVWLQSNTPYNNPYLDQIPLTVVLCNLVKPYIVKDKLHIFNFICQNKNIPL